MTSNTKKKLLIAGICGIVSIVIIASIILMCLFIPVHGKGNDDFYWSEYDAFDISEVQTVEMSGEDFKILQLTDLHYHLPHMTKETDDIVHKLVKDSAPDMIVITGDSVFGPTNMAYTKHLAKLMDSFEIPWAIVYGNHDDEGKADKYWMGDVYENSKYSLYKNGPYNIGGVGNYAVNIVKSGQPFYSVIMMDSNRVTKYNGREEYGSFTPSQVSWYSWLCDGLKKNGYDNSMMFFHIPFPEYLDAYENWESSGFDNGIGVGEKREGVCSAPYNPGMFTKITEKRHTGYVFVGHDHVNNYSVQYQGVRLSYGMKSSRQFYSDNDMIGGTLISINADKEVSIDYKYIDFSK